MGNVTIPPSTLTGMITKMQNYKAIPISAFLGRVSEPIARMTTRCKDMTVTMKLVEDLGLPTSVADITDHLHDRDRGARVVFTVIMAGIAIITDLFSDTCILQLNLKL